MHNWEQISTCLNGPHIWKCKACGEWTRSYDKPDWHAPLIDPDTGERYSGSRSHCIAELVGNGVLPKSS